MMETEGDTLTNTLLSDHGNYSDVMRKSFHNESISYLRKTNNEYVEVLESQLSALLSGTPGQVRKLIPDPENGLFSRFMYYHLPMKPDWNDVFADTSDVSLDDIYAALGRDWNEVYQRISRFEHISFSFTPQQQVQFNEHFSVLHEEYLQRYGEGILSSVRRMGLIVFKISMVLSLMRCMEFADESADFVCEDADFSVALTIGDTLLEHSAKFYMTFPSDTRNGTYSYKREEEERKRKAYQDLPDTFKTKEAVDIGHRHGLSPSTVKRWLKTSLFTNLSYGIYTKSQNDLVTL